MWQEICLAAMAASQIEQVTVYRAGARVERTMRCVAAATSARFESLPLSVDDASLRVEVEGGGVALDARVALEVPPNDPALAPAVDEAFESARRELAGARAEVARAMQ